MRCTQEMLDAAWQELKRVSMIPNMSTKEKLENAINAALKQYVEVPRDSIYVESKVRL